MQNFPSTTACGKFLHLKCSWHIPWHAYQYKKISLNILTMKVVIKKDLIWSYKQLINDLKKLAEQLKKEWPSHNDTCILGGHLFAKWQFTSDTKKSESIISKALFTNSCKFEEAIISLKCVCNKVYFKGDNFIDKQIHCIDLSHFKRYIAYRACYP